MLKREIQEIIDSENYFQHLPPHTLQLNTLKEDFFNFEQDFGRQLIFQNHQQPQDAIFAMVQDQKAGSYDEIEEIERRVKLVEHCAWDSDIIQELKAQYLSDRKEIVESGLTIWDLRHTYSSDIADQLDNEDDEISIFTKEFISERISKSSFIWELLDELFTALEKHNLSKSCKELELQQKTQSQISPADDQKIKQLILLFNQLTEVIAFRFGSESNDA